MEELNSSELGTKEYWERHYQKEVENFQNHGDVGEIWFGEESGDRIIRWLNRKSISKDLKIVDLGCGNGIFLTDLSKEEYSNLHGLDYSQKAIELANSIAEKENLSIKYKQADILLGLDENYDIIHDKGTYDAISLSNNSLENRKKYIENIHKSLTKDGYFLITSCNWTEEELDKQFGNHFLKLERIPTPQFKFGGKAGNVVTSIVYKRKE